MAIYRALKVYRLIFDDIMGNAQEIAINMYRLISQQTSNSHAVKAKRVD